MIDPSEAQDLLSNFETWPPEVQASFLDMFGQALAIDREIRTQASLSTLDMLIGDFRTALKGQQEKTAALMDELDQSEALTTFLKELHQSGELVRLIGEISNLHKQLNALMLKLTGK